MINCFEDFGHIMCCVSRNIQSTAYIVKSFSNTLFSDGCVLSEKKNKKGPGGVLGAYNNSQIICCDAQAG